MHSRIKIYCFKIITIIKMYFLFAQLLKLSNNKGRDQGNKGNVYVCQSDVFNPFTISKVQLHRPGLGHSSIRTFKSFINVLRKKTLMVCILRQNKGTANIVRSISVSLFQLKQLRLT